MTNIEFAKSLREIAAFYEAHPEMPQPENINVPIWATYPSSSRPRFLSAAKDLGTFTKVPPSPGDDYFFTIERKFDGFPFHVTTRRAEICRKVTKTVEIESWECPDSLLEELAKLEAAKAVEVASEETNAG